MKIGRRGFLKLAGGLVAAAAAPAFIPAERLDMGVPTTRLAAAASAPAPTISVRLPWEDWGPHEWKYSALREIDRSVVAQIVQAESAAPANRQTVYVWDATGMGYVDLRDVRPFEPEPGVEYDVKPMADLWESELDPLVARYREGLITREEFQRLAHQGEGLITINSHRYAAVQLEPYRAFEIERVAEQNRYEVRLDPLTDAHLRTAIRRLEEDGVFPNIASQRGLT